MEAGMAPQAVSLTLCVRTTLRAVTGSRREIRHARFRIGGGSCVFHFSRGTGCDAAASIQGDEGLRVLCPKAGGSGGSGPKTHERTTFSCRKIRRWRVIAALAERARCKVRARGWISKPPIAGAKEKLRTAGATII